MFDLVSKDFRAFSNNVILLLELRLDVFVFLNKRLNVFVIFIRVKLLCWLHFVITIGSAIFSILGVMYYCMWPEKIWLKNCFKLLVLQEALLETIDFPADFLAEIIPHEFLRILMSFPSLERNFLKIILPSENPHETSNSPAVLLAVPLTSEFRRYICGVSCRSLYCFSCGFFCGFGFYPNSKFVNFFSFFIFFL